MTLEQAQSVAVTTLAKITGRESAPAAVRQAPQTMRAAMLILTVFTQTLALQQQAAIPPWAMHATPAASTRLIQHQVTAQAAVACFTLAPRAEATAHAAATTLLMTTFIL